MFIVIPWCHLEWDLSFFLEHPCPLYGWKACKTTEESYVILLFYHVLSALQERNALLISTFMRYHAPPHIAPEVKTF